VNISKCDITSKTCIYVEGVFVLVLGHDANSNKSVRIEIFAKIEILTSRVLRLFHLNKYISWGLKKIDGGSTRTSIMQRYLIMEINMRGEKK